MRAHSPPSRRRAGLLRNTAIAVTALASMLTGLAAPACMTGISVPPVDLGPSGGFVAPDGAHVAWGSPCSAEEDVDPARRLPREGSVPVSDPFLLTSPYGVA